MDSSGLFNESTISDVFEDLERMNYTLTEDQRTSITALLSGKDAIAILPTGSGKSLIFQALAHAASTRGMKTISVIVTPLKAISYTHKLSFAKVIKHKL